MFAILRSLPRRSPWQQLLADNEIELQITPDLELEIRDVEQGPFEKFSIFREMFRDFDSESKLILLDEILVVGEHKELCFLGTLADDKDKRVRKKAFKIRQDLATKLGVSLDDSKMHRESAPEPLKLIIKADSDPIAEQQQTKLPLEYCFLEGPLPVKGEDLRLES